jgi:hypothetical protein
MHWAAHGHRAVEIVYQLVDARKPHMGLTNYKGSQPTKQETEITKNYLPTDELDILKRWLRHFWK